MNKTTRIIPGDACERMGKHRKPFKTLKIKRNPMKNKDYYSRGCLGKDSKSKEASIENTLKVTRNTMEKQGSLTQGMLGKELESIGNL